MTTAARMPMIAAARQRKKEHDARVRHRDSFYVWAFQVLYATYRRNGQRPQVAFVRAILESSDPVTDETVDQWRLAMADLHALKHRWPSAGRGGPTRAKRAEAYAAVILERLGVEMELRAWEIDALMAATPEDPAEVNEP